MRAEVLVVGGSLSGASLAAFLARAGVDVLVVEKARFPREKICGEFLSHEALPLLDRLGVLSGLRARGAERISGFRVARAGGTPAAGRLPFEVLSVSRALLDTTLAEAAEKAGARFSFGSTVTGLEGSLAEGFRVTTPKSAFEARVVVGAWGRYSPLDGRLGRAFYGTPAPFFGFKKHLRGASAHLKDTVALHVFAGGYLGLSRIEPADGEEEPRVNLGALATPEVATRAHHNLDELLEDLIARSPALARDLDGLEREPGKPLVSEPVHLGARDASEKDVLFVGDAAGVLDPWTGTGMAHALLSGEAAAEPVAAFLAGRLVDLPAEHGRAQRRLAGSRFFWSRAFRPFLMGRAARFVVPAAAPLATLAARLTRPSA